MHGAGFEAGGKAQDNLGVLALSFWLGCVLVSGWGWHGVVWLELANDP